MYKQQQDAIITLLEPLTIDNGPFKGYEIVHAPDTEAEFKKPFTKSRVTVIYIGSEFDDVRSTSLVSQYETLNWLFIVEARTTRGTSGIYEMLTNLRKFLLGYKLPWCDALTAGKIEIQDRDKDTALYTYNLTLQCKYLAVEDYTEPNDPLIQHITVDSSNGTLEIVAYLQEENESQFVLETEDGNPVI